MEKFDLDEGHWVTVGGRRIFIKDGESLSSAMKRSGKFKSAKKMSKEKLGNSDEDKEIKGRISELQREIASGRNDKEKTERLKEELSQYEKEYSMDGKKISESDIKSEYDREKARGNIDKDMSYEDYKKSIVDDRNSNVRSEKEEPEFLKNATDEEKRNYYKNVAEKEKSEKMGQDEYLAEKARERNMSDEKKDELSKKASEVVKGMRENNKSDLAKENKNLFKQEIEEDLKREGLHYDNNKGEEKWKQMQKDGYVMVNGRQYNLEDYSSSNKSDLASERSKQYGDIEKASGLKVERSFQTDAFGNGDEDHFELSDGRTVVHSRESLGKKEDSWSIEEVKNGSINSQNFKSYDEMIDHLKGGSGGSDKTFNPYSKERLESIKNALNNGTLNQEQENNALKDFRKITGGKRPDEVYNIENGKYTTEKQDVNKTSKEDFNRRAELMKYTQDNKDKIAQNVKDYDEKTNQQAFEKAKQGKALKAKEYFGFLGGQPKEGDIVDDKRVGKGGKLENISRSEYKTLPNGDRYYVGKAGTDDYYESVMRNHEGEFEPKGSNTAYKKAFQEYKKQHPNTKLTLSKFIDISEGR